mmetsp:Transcript_157975/g.278897  ORF Transcript_157975/g.278897 Transcript_157975/m.278897 type:complete len:111 (+) Transcript_157975:84-416(+)
MAIRSLRVGRAYRDLCRAAAATFRGDFHSQLQLRVETRRTLRQQVGIMSEADMLRDLQSGTDFIRYEIVQASYQPQSDNYKVHITQDHLEKRNVFDLQEPPDPFTGKKPY